MISIFMCMLEREGGSESPQIAKCTFNRSKSGEDSQCWPMWIPIPTSFTVGVRGKYLAKQMICFMILTLNQIGRKIKLLLKHKQDSKLCLTSRN